MLKNAPHPNAARLFIQHFLDIELQLIYANAWMLPVVRARPSAPMRMRSRSPTPR